MALIGTIDELENALGQMMLKGVQLSFGPSASPLRQGQWFANASSAGEPLNQARGSTLSEALNALLGRCEPLDLVSEPSKPSAPPPPASPTSLSSLLV